MGLRDTTADVDSVSALPPDLLDAAREVAREMGIKETWLNANALPWKPDNLDVAACIDFLSRESLRVVGVPPDALLLMKLNRSSEADQADMRRLWPRCTFATVHEAALAFRDAYPTEEPDPFLADHLLQILEG